MNPSNTLRLPRREPEARTAWFSYFWSVLAGLLVPVLIVLVGMIAQVLNSSGLHDSESRLGAALAVPLPDSFSGQAELIQLTELVCVVITLAVVFCFALWMNRRAADYRSRSVTRALHERLLKQSLRRAEVEGASAQYVRADALIGTHLPNLSHGLSLWYRSIPRSVLMVIGSVIVALLVNVWLTLLAVVSGVLVWQLFQRLRYANRDEVSKWEVPRSRGRMAEIVGRAPMLARLQTQGLAERAFETELDSLYRRLAEDDARRSRVWPLLFLASAVAISVSLLGLGVTQFSTNDSGLSLPAAITLALSLAAAAASAARLGQLARQLRQSSQATETIYHYLIRNDGVAPTEERVGLAKVRDSVEIRNVTLNGASGDAMLNDLSLVLKPGELVALMGTRQISTRALTELLMGFGRPSNGQVLLDGISLNDVHPQALAKNVMWIDPSGPLWEDTIDGNIRGTDKNLNNRDVVDTLERLGVYERVQRLPEGISTFVSDGDSGLEPDVTYAIGVARAMLHKPSVVLALEPPTPPENPNQDLCLQALKDLTSKGSLVVMLPRRLLTLRTADRVVLLKGNRLAGEGKHSDLVTDSDLYRHLNYLLFNPYRNQSS